MTENRKPWQRHKTEESRYQAQLESKRKYANQKWKCEPCNIIVSKSHKARHFSSKLHKSNSE